MSKALSILLEAAIQRIVKHVPRVVNEHIEMLFQFVELCHSLLATLYNGSSP